MDCPVSAPLTHNHFAVRQLGDSGGGHRHAEWRPNGTIVRRGSIAGSGPGQKSPSAIRTESDSAGCYSYTSFCGPGKTQVRPSRSRSRQFSQLWPSRDSTYRTRIPVAERTGTMDRFRTISGS